MERLDPMHTRPDQVAPHGRAWRRDLDAVRRAAGVGNDDAMLVSWIIEAPWAHPVWHSYNLTLVHLRPTERHPRPVIHVPGTTHEMMLFALDPLQPREPMLRTNAMAWLRPPNFAAQLVEPSDEEAIDRINATVASIIHGFLNPDTDALRDWINLFGDGMVRPEYRR